jgi:branched-chain amino acid transport system permease protein
MSAKPGYIPTRYTYDLAFYKTRVQRVVVGLGVLAVLLFPVRMGGNALDPFQTRQLTIATTIVAAIPVALALNLLTGMAGLVSLGTVAFLAVGAFTAAALGVEAGLPMAVVLVVATAFSALVGLIVGLPALRLRGLYLVVATMALHFVVIFAARKYQDPTVGVAGFRFRSPPELFGHPFSAKTWYVVMAVLAVLATVGFVNLRRSRYGRAWMMIREREIAAEVLGINVTSYKLLAFTVSSAVIGFMGALFAYRLRTIQVESFHLDIAIDYIAIIIIGGIGTVHGAIFGTVMVFGFPFLITELSIRLPRDSGLGQFLANEIYNINRILYGLAIVLFLLFEPRGLAAIWGRIRTWFALWPFSRERIQ